MTFLKIILIVALILILMGVLLYIFYIKYVNYTNKNLEESKKIVDSFYKYLISKKIDNNVLDFFDKDSVFLGEDSYVEILEDIKYYNEKYGKVISYKLVDTGKPMFILEESISSNSISLWFEVKREKANTTEDFSVVNKNNKYYISMYNADKQN